MDYLIIYAHPNSKSFNHAIREKIEQTLKKKSKTYEVRDLYAMYFNPLLSANDIFQLQQKKISEDVKKEQDFISQAQTLIFVHPIWWFSMPAILKGYVDRVFSQGFAYDVTDQGARGLLVGKKVMIFNTTGGSEENYLEFGYKEALQKIFAKGTYEFCGMNVVQHKFFFAVQSVSHEARTKMLDEIDWMTF